jgi:hypothetical protein
MIRAGRRGAPRPPRPHLAAARPATAPAEAAVRRSALQGRDRRPLSAGRRNLPRPARPRHCEAAGREGRNCFRAAESLPNGAGPCPPDDPKANSRLAASRSELFSASAPPPSEARGSLAQDPAPTVDRSPFCIARHKPQRLASGRSQYRQQLSGLATERDARGRPSARCSARSHRGPGPAFPSRFTQPRTGPRGVSTAPASAVGGTPLASPLPCRASQDAGAALLTAAPPRGARLTPAGRGGADVCCARSAPPHRALRPALEKGTAARRAGAALPGPALRCHSASTAFRGWVACISSGRPNLVCEARIDGHVAAPAAADAFMRYSWHRPGRRTTPNSGAARSARL